MQTQALGGGLLIAVAALLWAIYFLPTWARRRQFRVAEHNALRIQRTLRMLAETTEVPTEVRVEASAREALAQERLLASTERIAVAQQKARLADAKLAERKAALEAREVKRQAALMRRELIKRSRPVRLLRAAMAVLLLVALIGMIAGVVLGAVGFGWTVLSASAGLLLVSGLTLFGIAPTPKHLLEQRVATRQAPTAVEQASAGERPMPAPAAQPVRERPHRRPAATAAVKPRQATPQQSASPEDVAAAQQLLERARAVAEAQQRASAQPAGESSTADDAGVGQRPAQRPPVRPGEPQAVNRARLQTMGVIEDLDTDLPNVDAVLQRRRAAS